MRNLFSFLFGILSDLLYALLHVVLLADSAALHLRNTAFVRAVRCTAERLARSRAAAAALLFGGCFFLPFSLLTQPGVLVLADGRPLGCVENAEVLSGMVREIEQSASAAAGKAYALPYSLSVQTLRAPACEFLSENELRGSLTAQSGELDTLAVISVDGRRTGICRNTAEAQTLLDSVKRLYTSQADSSADFVQQVRVDNVVAESRLAGEPETVF